MSSFTEKRKADEAPDEKSKANTLEKTGPPATKKKRNKVHK
jgi:hypothetical protein